jgi:competence ComEA-like helix-hairpin-helix protein
MFMQSFKFVLTLIFLLSSLTFISAICEDGQIDINSAFLEELDNLTGIGPVKAQAIIDTRPFDSIDNLIKVSGIGNVTLNNIKSQGLACIDDEKTDRETEEIVNNDTNIDNSSITESEVITNLSLPKEIKLETINLDTKAIKSEENSLVLNKSNYAFYGLFAFAVLLALLFLIKRNKKKNELT